MVDEIVDGVRDRCHPGRCSTPRSAGAATPKRCSTDTRICPCSGSIVTSRPSTRPASAAPLRQAGDDRAQPLRPPDRGARRLRGSNRSPERSSTSVSRRRSSTTPNAASAIATKDHSTCAWTAARPSAADVVNGYDERRPRPGHPRLRRRTVRPPHRQGDRRRPADHDDRPSSPRPSTAAIPAATRRTGGHPAKRTFQALRIEVNGELDQLPGRSTKRSTRPSPRGRVAVLTYHSGEDRIVKQRFSEAATGACTCPPGLPCVCGATPTVRRVRVPRTPSDEQAAEQPARALGPTACRRKARDGTMNAVPMRRIDAPRRRPPGSRLARSERLGRFDLAASAPAARRIRRGRRGGRRARAVGRPAPRAPPTNRRQLRRACRRAARRADAVGRCAAYPPRRATAPDRPARAAGRSAARAVRRAPPTTSRAALADPPGQREHPARNVRPAGHRTSWASIRGRWPRSSPPRAAPARSTTCSSMATPSIRSAACAQPRPSNDCRMTFGPPAPAPRSARPAAGAATGGATSSALRNSGHQETAESIGEARAHRRLRRDTIHEQRVRSSDPHRVCAAVPRPRVPGARSRRLARRSSIALVPGPPGRVDLTLIVLLLVLGGSRQGRPDAGDGRRDAARPGGRVVDPEPSTAGPAGQIFDRNGDEPALSVPGVDDRRQPRQGPRCAGHIESSAICSGFLKSSGPPCSPR